MASMHETAYPRLKSTLSEHELTEVYTPSAEEMALAIQSTKGTVARLGFLVTLKTFQRLGYFIPIATVPPAIIAHIAQTATLRLSANDPVPLVARYDDSGSRRRHTSCIRTYLDVQPFGAMARHLIVQAMGTAAQTKDEVADLINVAIEELVRHRFELPAFATLNRAARRVRATLYRTFYRQVFQALREAERNQIDALFTPDPTTKRTPWNDLRQDAGPATLKHLQQWAERMAWLSSLHIVPHALAAIPDVKIKQFATEAKSLDAARMAALEPQKRAALIVALLSVQSAQVRDDLAEMLIKRIARIHHKGKEALEQYRAAHQQTTDTLVAALRDVIVAYQTPGTEEQRFQAVDGILVHCSDELLQQCDAHIAHVGDNYLPFLWHIYKTYRVALLRILQVIQLRATSQDTALETAIAFLLSHQTSRRPWLDTSPIQDEGTPHEQRVPLLDLSWIPPAWWRLVTGQRSRDVYPARIDRRQFEVCLFSQLMWELKSGDLFVEGSDVFADYRPQLVSLEEYQARVAEYGQRVGLPLESSAFVAHVQTMLETTASQTDQAFPSNQHVHLEKGMPIIHRPARQAAPDELTGLERLLEERLDPINVVDVLADTEHWLNWTRFFGPLSGHDTKLANPVARYLTTVFWYGCSLGPSQTARALGYLDRRQIAWPHQHHITADTLDEAIRWVINAYNRFPLPKIWGSGKHASADGTKWDIYEQNLLAEYHIRYGGYGGIGYYHVSDTYIALFSHFIPCGVWEGIYILDPLFNNPPDIHPDTRHADTQGQRAPSFGLAYLLGIRLMPRIRNWQDLNFYRPHPGIHYEPIDARFTQTIDGQLIATHLPDMLRVALSIQAGRITASAILRRLGTYSRKNRLYRAFRELGRAVRTGFLLDYLNDVELRTLIREATNKSESFNGFTKWLSFGGDQTILANDRDEQRKLIKYNHLVANCLIFYNVFAISRILHERVQTGEPLAPEVVAALSPYWTNHINRFGRYHLDLTRRPPAIDYAVAVVTQNSHKSADHR